MNQCFRIITKVLVIEQQIILSHLLDYMTNLGYNPVSFTGNYVQGC